MAEFSDIVERADSLMRRRRSFVATPTSKAESASVPLLENDDDDLPVLTEVVSEAAVSEAAAITTERFDETQVSLLASEIAHAIGQQLTYELPTLLEATLITAGEELRAGITATMETALRDFIARRKQLSLPLDEPNRND
ncbi:hypothetical protein [Propionivibrio sp.]|uniref:hypothetical protein n=1 Tax=Propionivibrio sp. TaxID=2212460 RepID=UPI003BF13670